ncbi:DUF3566 domain-containing protein [Aeromicrobium sp. YIM 150415]|uniref:DUF3566 domain-containing protein n=1 Tax=Aeromicrobium sp. YIM 150415 TaxID=2803912 RepID=UPI0027DD4FBD|nr:DUF3566 domain-containing protein [Aeromicrobium sp. YIM 150415]
MTEKSPGDSQGKRDSPTQEMPRVEADQDGPKKPGNDAKNTTESAETSAPKSGGAAAPSGAKPGSADGGTASQKSSASTSKTSPSSSSASEAPAAKKQAAGAKPEQGKNPEKGKNADTGKPDSSKKPGGGEKPSVSARQPLSRPSGGTATGGPRKPLSGLSKDEYTRTTASSPDATSVIPAVKDDKPAPESDTTKDTGTGTSTVKDKTEKFKGKLRGKGPATPPAEQQVPARGKADAATTKVEVEQDATEPGRALLRLRYIEPWSVTRLAFVISVALMIVAVVAMAVFWVVLQITGVWGALNDSVTNILSDDAGSFDVSDYFGFGRLVGLTLVLSALNVVFMTALATIAAHLYNLSASILGGLKVTFLEDQR